MAVDPPDEVTMRVARVYDRCVPGLWGSFEVPAGALPLPAF
jgi:hypothetical protein